MCKLEGMYALAPRARLRTALVLCARLLVAAMLVALGLFALPTSAFAQATIEQVSIPYTEGPYPVDDTCLGFGVVGILTGGGTITGQVVETDTGFHFSGTDTFEYRIDFPDGSYVLGTLRSPLYFNENPLTGHVTFGGIIVDKGTIYDANGTVIGHGIFHGRRHTTIVDGTVVVAFDEGSNRCL
jgi:hypothetical protein